MRRRRQKNPLLMKIVGISVVANIILLAVLARYAAVQKFKKQQYALSQMIVRAAPSDNRKIEEKAKKTAAKQPHAAKTARTSGAHASHANPNQLKVAVATGKGGGDTGGDGVEQGTKVGPVLPPTDNSGGTKPVTPTAPPATDTSIKPAAPVLPVVPVEPTKPKPVVTPEVVKPQPVAPKEPVFTAAAPVNDDQPKPEIPDDLRQDALDKTFTADVTVSPEGMPIAVSLAQSTGNDELDKIALATAKKWRFKPATRDGEPVEGRVRMTIEFQVN